MISAEALARAFHDAKESLAPGFDRARRGPWADLPEPERQLDVAAAASVLATLEKPVPSMDVTLEAWRAACRESTGLDDEYIEAGVRFRWRIGQKSVRGATGTIEKEVGSVWKKSNSWRVELDGRVTRGTRFLLRTAPAAVSS